MPEDSRKKGAMTRIRRLSRSTPSSSSASVASSGPSDRTAKSKEDPFYDESQLELGDSYQNAFEVCSLDLIQEYATIAKTDIRLHHEHITSRSAEEAAEILRTAIREHDGDPCLPHGKVEALQGLVDDFEDGSLNYCSDYNLKFEAFLIHDWSIYSEVRSATRPIEEKGEEYETFRVYFIGTLWACLGAALDTFFSTRFPSISLDSGSILVMLAATGKLFAKLPTLYIPWFRGKRFYINKPGHWTFKEQMLATLAMKVGVGSPYAMRAVVAQSNPHFLNIDAAKSFGYIFLLICSSNFMGFGIAGIMRQFLVYPTRCVWYNILPSINVNRVLVSPEARTSVYGWRLKGAEFFGVFMLVSFAWYWVTNYLFEALSYFDWPAWLAPHNVHLQAITGCINGLSLNPINTFDWNNIGAISITTPVFAQVMGSSGTFLSMLALIAMWYCNTSWTSYLPINTTTLYDNNAKPWRVDKVLDSSKLKLDETRYQQYSPPFWSAGVLVNQGGALMLYSGMMVYTLLNYRKPIHHSLKMFGQSFMSTWKDGGDGGLSSHKDRFARAQRKYKEVPEWCFILVMCIAIGIAIVTVEVYKFTQTPVWTIFFAIGLSALFCVPFGILHATTSISMEINVLFELIIGLALPGNPNALMVSKVFASNFFSQSCNFITNQVEAHYTGIAPRALFRAQICSVMASVVVKALLAYWVVSPSGIPDLCDPLNKEKFNCMHQRSFFNAAIQWGAIGPRRLFGGMYKALPWCFLAGALYPLPFWLARKYVPRYTNKLNWALHGIHEMAILTGVNWAPNSLQYVIGVIYVNILFNHWVKNRYPMWWQKYAYTFAHAMDVGVAYAGLIIFFGTQYRKNVSLDWWGNSIPYEVGDARGMPLTAVPLEPGYFGPEKGSFP